VPVSALFEEGQGGVVLHLGFLVLAEAVPHQAQVVQGPGFLRPVARCARGGQPEPQAVEAVGAVRAQPENGVCG
jgi:hypothetical protein